MTPRSPAMLPALVAALAALHPGTLLGAERSCPAMAVEPDAAFRQRFPELLERIESEFRARDDIDACARIELTLHERDMIDLSVTLPDGRAAARSVTRRDDVIPTLQALLLVPEQVATVAAAAKAAPTPPVRRAPRVRLAAEPARDMPEEPAQPARQLGFELSVITGARIGDGQYGYGVGALSFLEIKSWLIGFEGRADGYRTLQGGDPETALELAFLAGKRLDFGSMALDLTLGPAIAMKGLSFSDVEVVSVAEMPPAGEPAMPPPRRLSEPSSGPVPRLLVGARLGFSPRSIFRTFVGIDGEVGPARAPVAPGDEVRSPGMPNFTVGLALGATVGTR